MPLIEMITINDSEKTPMWEWIHDFCVCLSFCWILLFNECYSCHQWLISWLMITNYVKCCPSAFAFSQAKVKNQLEPKTSFSWSLRARKSNESTKNWNIPPRAVFMKVGGGWRSKRPSIEWKVVKKLRYLSLAECRPSERDTFTGRKRRGERQTVSVSAHLFTTLSSAHTHRDAEREICIMNLIYFIIISIVIIKINKFKLAFKTI